MCSPDKSAAAVRVAVSVAARRPRRAARLSRRFHTRILADKRIGIGDFDRRARQRAHMVLAEIDGDLVQPRSEFRFAAKSLGLEEYLQKDFLAYIGCLSMIAYLAPHERVQPNLMTRHQFLKRALAAAQERLH